MTQDATGTQSISRACKLLVLINGYGPLGASLTDLTRASRLSQPTVHRMLRCLVNEEFLRQNALTKHYIMGPAAFEFGLTTTPEMRVVERIRPFLERLRISTRDTLYLLQRSGPFSVCLERLDGMYPLGSFKLTPGTAHPLGLGAGGLALLACLDDKTARQIIRRNSAAYPGDPVLKEDSMLDRVRSAQRLGRVVSEGTVFAGMAGTAVVIPIGNRTPYLAIGIGGTHARMPDTRLAALHEQLTSVASQIAMTLSDMAGENQQALPKARLKKRELDAKIGSGKPRIRATK